MAILPILELPHPTLRQRARKVRNIDSSILRIAYDMVDTLHDAHGVGLAANQVGDLHRIIVIHVPEEEDTRIYINPEIVQRDGEREVEEGCLSIPGYKGIITRSVWIRFSALDHTAEVVKLKAEDLLSQALEHEVDHLNGILYIDHLASHNKLMKVEPHDPDDEPEAEETDDCQSDAPENADMPRSESDEQEQDSQDTPASLKVR